MQGEFRVLMKKFQKKPSLTTSVSSKTELFLECVFILLPGVLGKSLDYSTQLDIICLYVPATCGFVFVMYTLLR